MTAFTPGPWCVATGKNISVGPVGGGQRVALCNYDNGSTEKANARLIAAAPDLYAALDRLLSNGDVRDAMHKGELKQARAALARVQGETK